MLDGDPSPVKGAQPPVFGPCLLRPNGWTDEDASWYGSRSRPRPHCVTRRPPAKGAQQQSPSFRPISIVATTAQLLFFKVQMSDVITRSPDMVSALGPLVFVMYSYHLMIQYINLVPFSEPRPLYSRHPTAFFPCTRPTSTQELPTYKMLFSFFDHQSSPFHP